MRPIQKLLNPGRLWLPQDRKEGRHAAKQEEEEPPCASLRSGRSTSLSGPVFPPRPGARASRAGTGPADTSIPVFLFYPHVINARVLYFLF